MEPREIIDLLIKLADELENLRDHKRELRARLRTVKKSLEGPKHLKAHDPARIPGGTGRLPPERAFIEYLALEEELKDLEERINTYQAHQERLKKHFLNNGNIDIKVGILRNLEGLRLHKIAEELDYSEEWVRKVSARIGKNGEEKPY